MSAAGPIVNLRCVEGLDIGALEVEKFDGRSHR